MKLCLAGNWPKVIDQYIEALDDSSIFLLQTFWDYRNDTPKNEGLIQLLLKKCEFFILDSGAFSMIYGGKRVELTAYIQDYIDFIIKYKIKNYIELDLYDVIGVEKTLAIRSNLEKQIGYPSIPVFHKSLGKDGLITMLTEYDYIAVGGIATGGRKGYDNVIMAKICQLGRKHNCKVHGLGYTPLNGLETTGFYSVDSTTWLTPLRFGGMVHVFKGGQIHKHKQPKGTSIKVQHTRVHQFAEWLKLQEHARIY